MSDFAKGDYVKFVGMFGDGGVGRVASVGGNGLVFVCFTAAIDGLEATYPMMLASYEEATDER